MLVNLIDYFERTVQRAPDKTALFDGEKEISFRTLRSGAQSLALRLIEKGLTCAGKPVAIYLPKSIECTMSAIAILYASNAYMNLDIQSPAQRIRNIIECIKPELIITDAKHKKSLSGLWDEKKIVLVDEPSAEGEADTALLYRRLSSVIDTDLCCIINTSGSTGTPKGVALTHRSFIDYTEWAVSTGLTGDEVVGCLCPIMFDHHSFKLCLMMATGSSLVLIPGHLAAFPARIVELLQKHKVTFIFWVPTIMVNIANMGLLDDMPLPSLKTVWFAGEVFPTRQFNLWRKALPRAKFVNLYGPAEITVDCTYYVVERDIADDEPIPIGYACRNTGVLLLTEDDRPAAPGEPGEICVRGTSLAMGYYNNPEKTALAFMQNPLNSSYPETIYRTGDIGQVNERGEILFKGRKDTLIKHSGYRIELAEIEHVAINTLRLVENACVLYHAQKRQITMVYQHGEDIPPEVFRKALTGALPKYMVPSAYIRREQMPRNPNGKIDRSQLAQELLEQ